MGAVVDSSIFIAAERGKLDLVEKLVAHGNEPVAMAAITASELLHGVQGANDLARRTRRKAFVEHLLAKIPVVSFDLVAARIHAHLSADLAQRGEPVGAQDLLIGATALGLGFGVVTRDVRNFPQLSGLNVLRW